MTSSDLDLRLLRFRSRRDEAPHGLASALIEAGRSSDALEVIHLGLLDDERDLELVTLEGRAYYAQGDLPQAQRSLLRAAKINPRHKEPYRWLAQVLIERGDAVRAVQVLERAISIDPQDGPLRQAHARAQRLVSLNRRPSDSQRPASEAPGKLPRPSLRASVASPLTQSERPRSQPPPREPSRRPLSQPPAASQPRGSQPRASQPVRGSEPRRPISERPGAASLETQRPPARGAPWRPGEARPLDRVAPMTAPLPFDEEVDRDDEAPTTAVEVPEELRERLRRESSPPSPQHVLPADGPQDDEDGDMTSIVPAAEELQMLRAQQAARDVDPTQEVDERHLGEHARTAAPGEAEPPEEVLQVLQRQGVFEPPGTGTATPDAWLPTEVPKAGTPIKRALAVGWGLALAAALAGYLGFQSWLDARRAEAARMVERGSQEAADGEHHARVSAERTLSEARALDPRSTDAMEALLFVQAERALEDGDAPVGPLRESVTRAEQMKLSSPLLYAARKLLTSSEQRKAELSAILAYADKEAASDPRATYVLARIVQRAGQPAAAARLLARATASAPELALAQVALGELQRAEGQLEQAREAFGKALGADGRMLRAELWLALLDGKEGGAALLEKLSALKPRLEKASSAERLLAASARTFALLAQGDGERAREALREGATLQVDDPELLALYAEQALRAGEHTLAYRSARAASDAGGDARRYQTIVAASLLQQGDGDAALTALANLGGEGHGALALARASAALLSNQRESLEAAKKELASYRLTPLGKDDPEASSLLMRLDLRLGANVESLLPAARSLVQRAKDKLASHLALAEALVTAGQGEQAVAALEPALALSPGSADALYLLGRAQTLAGKPSEARQSLERAIAIAPNHLAAQRALGRALLDGGEYEAALMLFRGLESAAGSSASLGVIEALLGQGKLDDAAAKLSALPEPARSSPPAVLLRARLDLARGEHAAARTALEPLLAEDAETRTPEALALKGDILLAEERLTDSTKAYEEALELDETYPEAQAGLAQAFIQSGRSDAALPWIARAEASLVLRARPPSLKARVIAQQGRVALARGQAAVAREKLASAVALPGAPAELVYWYGEALAKDKAVAEANAQFQRYLELAPNGQLAGRARKALALE